MQSSVNVREQKNGNALKRKVCMIVCLVLDPQITQCHTTSGSASKEEGEEKLHELHQHSQLRCVRSPQVAEILPSSPQVFAE